MVEIDFAETARQIRISIEALGPTLKVVCCSMAMRDRLHAILKDKVVGEVCGDPQSKARACTFDQTVMMLHETMAGVTFDFLMAIQFGVPAIMVNDDGRVVLGGLKI